MATHKSDQRTNLDSTPSKMVKANELGGRVRIAYFSFTVPVGNAAIADIVELVSLRKGWRILGGHAAWDAMTTGAGVATMELGVSGTVAKYLEATDVDAAGSSDFADTGARNFGEEIASDAMLIATVSVEAWAAAAVLTGYILYAEG